MGRLRLILLLAVVVATAVGAFRVSIAVWGSWWRFDGAPTAEEWSAFFGGFVVIGLVFAWYQIRQVDRSNRALAASNEETRRVNIETIRPRLLVDLGLHRSVFKDRRAAMQGTVVVEVANLSASTARNVCLSVEPPFQSLAHFFLPDKMPAAMARVNSVFDGSVSFEHLASGRRHGYILGRFPKIFEATPEMPRRYVVIARYTDMSGQHHFEDTFTLDLDVAGSVEVATDPVTRLGKDVEVIGDELSLIRRAMKDRTAVLEDDADAIGQARRRSLRPSRVRSWRSGLRKG